MASKSNLIGIQKNFRLNIFIRLMIVIGLAGAFSLVVATQPWFFVPIVIALILLALIINLIRYIEKSNRDLTHWLLTIRQGAFTESYTSGERGKPFEELSEALNEVVEEFARVNAEKELHYQYLRALNESINVAILSFDENGNLIMMNVDAKRLLNQPAFAKVSDFKKIDSTLFKTVESLQTDARAVIKAYIREEPLQLSVQVKEIVLQGKKVRIVLLQNLNVELEAKEIEAWHQLLRVLTHEIMNSVTPIASLTDAVQTLLNNPDGTRKDLSTLSDETIEDIFSSIKTISSRSRGLLKFVESYKQYAKPVEAHLETVDIVGLVSHVTTLLKPELEKLRINLRVNNSYTVLYAKADEMLIEQVLINLIKNATEAVPHDGSGNIMVGVEKKLDLGVRISVADNGHGMDAETLTRIFIPFYTTKAKGTGIGLSLSKQIMKLHHGTIRVTSAPGKGSVFTMEWY